MAFGLSCDLVKRTKSDNYSKRFALIIEHMLASHTPGNHQSPIQPPRQRPQRLVVAQLPQSALVQARPRQSTAQQGWTAGRT